MNKSRAERLEQSAAGKTTSPTFAVFGVRTRLFLAFFGISGFAVIASIAAMYAFLQVNKSLDEITQRRVPTALASQQLSRQAERVVAMAPAFLTVTTTSEHERLSAQIAAEVDQLKQLSALVTASNVGPEYLTTIKPSVERLVGNLSSLGQVISEQIEASKYMETLLRDLSNTHVAIQRLLAPGLRVMESDLSRLRNTAHSQGMPSGQQSLSAARSAQSIAKLQPLQKAQFEESAFNYTLLRSASARSTELPVIRFPLERSLKSLESLVADMDKRMQPRMLAHLGELRAFIDGPKDILKARRRELEISENARRLLDGNAELSRQLTAAVDQLVAKTNKDIEQSDLNARSVQKWSAGILLTVVGLSLLSSILIVWLYVGRNLISRLTALSDSMRAIADGNLEASIPSGGNDEIADMSNALIVFRDTAIEVRASNLREITEARRRLLHAIESISEGFSLYDAEDRLVICNSNYKEKFYPGLQDFVEPGVSFEAIAREAAERKLVGDAEGRIDEWVAERIARHRKPGEPHLQRSSDGRWILISERHTDDGGTVAVYADITELKQREEELANKSNALEQLSTQLAKYLSPQVYDSIFRGKQQVKLVSNRKKLTIFFSDIVEFTESADRMESEELTLLINHYLTEMSRIALGYGATIDKYVGDAIMIFFGDPESRGTKEDATNCVKMAIDMQKKLRDLADLWRDSGVERPLQVRMGINTGYCTVGNFGSEDRMDYTIIGGAVNIASRLENLSAPGEILISYETFAHVKDEIQCVQHGEVEVKGIAYPVDTYRVIDTYKNLGSQSLHFHEEHSNVSLDIDLGTMTKAERKPAIEILKRAIEVLKDEN